MAKHPFSVPYASPPGIRPTKSSWIGFEPFCVVNVVVVFPVPDSPMIMKTLSPAAVGITLRPACSARPPFSKTMLFHIRRPPFFDSPK